MQIDIFLACVQFMDRYQKGEGGSSKLGSGSPDNSEGSDSARPRNCILHTWCRNFRFERPLCYSEFSQLLSIPHSYILLKDIKVVAVASKFNYELTRSETRLTRSTYASIRMQPMNLRRSQPVTECVGGYISSEELRSEQFVISPIVEINQLRCKSVRMKLECNLIEYPL